ncbi:glycosyltransferase family 2 protein [Sphingobium amiense]|uniref:Glycosyltransferase family 2 protein n=1 Tax=Sphingobium amiense TaxID=135719 RepID=A0A494WFD0_9SPHN|nr:glycosyltransferase family 2 protein [Sphingobium amiense]BBD99720.1 glycosyltransferase family 2 protein [Sphingobium amiense]
MSFTADTHVPRVSVVIPAYNSAALIGATLRTVIDQTMPDWEAIIVDDCSTDDLAAVIDGFADPRIRLIRHRVNGGASAARNTGIAAAKGRFIAFLDADDAWVPDKLERQLAAVLAQPDPDRVFCVTRMVVTLGDGRQLIRPVRGKRPDERMDEFIFVEAGFCQTSTFLASADLIRSIGGFRLLPIGEDHLFAIDLCNAGAQYLLIDAALATYVNEIRDNRLSRMTSLEDGKIFMAAVRDTLSPRAMLAYHSRYLGAWELRRNPLAGLALLFRAVAAGVLSPRQAAILLMRSVISHDLYHKIRAKILFRQEN